MRSGNQPVRTQRLPAEALWGRVGGRSAPERAGINPLQKWARACFSTTCAGSSAQLWSGEGVSSIQSQASNFQILIETRCE
jgi:hypothetical protein